MKNLFRLFLLGLFVISVYGCSSTTDPSSSYPGETPKQIFAKGKAALVDHSYAEAAKRFEALDVQYPFDADTEMAQLYLVYAYYMKEDYALSQAAADRFARLHPTNAHLDYVFYVRGLASFYQNMGVIEQLFSVDLANRDLTQMKKSYYDFQGLIQRYPRSPYAPPAHQYLIYLRNIFANHELHVAQFYYDNKAYVAAVNRASAVVARYQGAPAVRDALLLMIKCYDALKQERLKQDVMRVYQANYR